MLRQLKAQLSHKLELLPFGSGAAVDRTKYIPLGSESPPLGHRRQVSLSSFNARKSAWIAAAGLFVLAVFLAASTTYPGSVTDRGTIRKPGDNGPIAVGKSVYDLNGHETFWWEQFPPLKGFYKGRKDIVLPSQYVPEQNQAGEPFGPPPTVPPGLIHAADAPAYEPIACSIVPPIVPAYDGIPQGMPLPLFGSMEEMGISQKYCYDRIHRYGPYGLDTPAELGGLGVELHGENERDNHLDRQDMAGVKWGQVQEDCVQKNEQKAAGRARTAFILRTWHTYKYTPHTILMLRAMINELSLRTGGQTYVHFLIHVQDDTLPIWASEDVYNETLKNALPPEFEGMGTLWSVAQMKLIYPPPFPESIINFSGGDVYDAYRSLHFPMQYFASKHPEFDFFWQWEMDIRVTGHYGQLLDKAASWADKQSRDHLWERSAKFFIPALYNHSYGEYSQSVVEETAALGKQPISGPQLPSDQLLPIPAQPAPTEHEDITDLITFSPLFDPHDTQWAFHDDITGYPPQARPPTRAALIAATRMSRRLLMLMHEETYRNKHTMFPEMYPASIALHYGLKAVYAPITTYFDRDWDAAHANEIFNNAKLRPESIAAGMDNGQNYFHGGPGGSVFGPGEHVFRGATWYSNAAFAGYLWRRWLGNENANNEVEWEFSEGHGRMCLPMMVLHTIKNDA